MSQAYYCLKCGNDEDFYRVDKALHERFVGVNIHGQTLPHQIETGDYILTQEICKRVYCADCHELVEMIEPPPEELDDDAFEAYMDDEHGGYEAFGSAGNWRKADPIAFELARQDENLRRWQEWEQKQKEQET